MANRRLQIEKMQQKASEFSDGLDELAMDMQESLDNLPESLFDSQMAVTMQERIDAVEILRDALSDFSEEEL